MRRPLSRFAAPALLLLLPCAVFLALFHPATLDIGNPGWLIRGTDNGENALGLHAWLHDPAAGASLRTGLLNAPEGVPVLYTDSNPLVALAASPFAALLPADAQFVGPFVLLSLILQALFAWLLLRRHAPGPLALWCGVVLLAFPPTLANRFIHANLMAHWTILAALLLFLDPGRSRGLRWWGPLIAVTALIHSYLLVMVGAIWAAALLARFRDTAGRARAALVLEGALVLIGVATLAWWLGVGGQVPASNFGRYSMPPDALWNPGIGPFPTLLPGSKYRLGHGFEGFQYLGMGGLLLVLAAIITARRRPAAAGERAVGQRLRALVPALIVLAVLALTPRLPLPEIVFAALDPVRSAGRLFWPVGYVLVLMAVLAVFRLSAKQAGLTLAAMIAIQAIDLAGLAGFVRAQSAEAGRHRLYVRTLDPRWDKLIQRAQSIAFMPGNVRADLALFQEVAWRAAKAGKPVTSVYAARVDRATARRLPVEAAAFARGELVPGRLYVLLAGAAVPPAAAAQAMTLDRVTVIVPSTPR